MYEVDNAYPVPFRLHRRPPTYRLLNCGREPVRGVTFTLHGAGVMAANEPATLQPGEQLELTIAAREIAQSTIMVVRWFRPDGVEYLWRVRF